ncbi:MAG: DUF2807 domain-containing protein [Sphingomonas sp.]|uniref:head GIN domain-containing protein n=1 Tax=Sphingomonas sp. TaxID=28214 RepID=UPI001AD566EA|nr:head GIN domain-containing protein [Sphingomonas sp.]MBN8808064.1 DUF2807 domain-containing protein [Sphingomonas sp.]
MRALALIALASLAACSNGSDARSSGTGGARTFAVDGFSAVESSGPDDVDVRVGSGFSIRAEGDPKVLDRLEIARNGDTLTVRRKSGLGWSWGGDRGAKVFITMPRITAARLTGSGDMAIDHVEGDGFDAEGTGSGDLTVGSITVQHAAFGLTGSGSITAAGTARTGTMSITGSGDIDAAKLKFGEAKVDVMGSGGVTAIVAGPAKVNVMGSGDVTLTGGAKCTTSKMGSGDISCS